MNKLEVGMYVRTDNGIIGKIYEQIGDMFTYKDSNRDYITYGLSHNEILKASHNIIDLIEVGDYVNGELVVAIHKNYVCDEIKLGIALETACNYTAILNEDIKSIVTHEQMEQMAYKVVSE